MFFSLNATEISKELDECRQGRCSVTKCLAQLKHQKSAFEDSPQTDPTSTITTYQNIQPIQQIEMRYPQISICRLSYELDIPTTTVYEIIR